jgi:hypothetical protein
MYASLHLRLLALGLVALLLPTTLSAEQAVRAFVFGDTSFQPATDGQGTSVSRFIDQLAGADGHGFAADGYSGGLQDFATTFPPPATWTTEGAVPLWDSATTGFRLADFNTFILVPGPLATIDADSIDLTKRLFDWVQQQADAPQVLIHDGWPATGGADLAALVTGVQAELSGLDLRLIPVAAVMDQVLAEPVLAGIPDDAIFSATSPGGTPTAHLFSAMVTYAVLYREPPPVIALPDAVHFVLRDNYAHAAMTIWVAVSGAILPDGKTVLSPGPLDDPWLGIGLFGISDWSTQSPFIDLMKTARPWLGHTADQWGVWDAARFAADGYLDADGWLTAMPPGLDRVEALILTDQLPGARSLAGRYRVTYDGTGDLTVNGLATDIRRQSDGIWFSYRPGPGLVAVSISAINPADPIRNITVLREDLIPAYEAGETFNPDWLWLISDMRALRFMDMMQTNGSTQMTSADRPKPDDYTYSWRGMPVEVMVALANRVGADPWFTLPHMADDDYVATFATYVRDHLRPGLMVYAEWSNEVWNFSFPQAQWAADQAQARWGDQGENAWMQFAGLRAAEVADIWANVFGPETDDRLVRVVSTHTAWLGLEDPLLTAPLAQAEGLPPPFLSFDAYAVTGYFGHEIGSEEMAPQLRDWIAQGTAVAQVTQMLRQGSVDTLMNTFWPHHARVARAHDLRLVMYEGGTHLVGQGPVLDDQGITDFLTSYNYSPEMAALYATIMSGWEENGGTLFNQFLDVSAPTKWGSWGALRHLDDMNPRWATLDAFNAAMPVTWETRAPGSFADQPVTQE